MAYAIAYYCMIFPIFPRSYIGLNTAFNQSKLTFPKTDKNINDHSTSKEEEFTKNYDTFSANLNDD